MAGSDGDVFVPNPAAAPLDSDLYPLNEAVERIAVSIIQNLGRKDTYLNPKKEFRFCFSQKHINAINNETSKMKENDTKENILYALFIIEEVILDSRGMNREDFILVRDSVAYALSKIPNSERTVFDLEGDDKMFDPYSYFEV